MTVCCVPVYLEYSQVCPFELLALQAKYYLPNLESRCTSAKWPAPVPSESFSFASDHITFVVLGYFVLVMLACSGTLQVNLGNRHRYVDWPLRLA